jgi:hypothetical protein
MVPSTKSTRLQLGMKQSKIVGFGRITKAAPAAVSQKACHPRIAPAVRLHEPPDSCPVTSKKRKHDAPDGASDSENGEQIEAPVLKKVRIIVLSPPLPHFLTVFSQDSSDRPPSHPRRSHLATTRLQSLLSHHAQVSALSTFRTNHPPHLLQLQPSH